MDTELIDFLIKISVFVIVYVICAYVVPFFKQKFGNDVYTEILAWTDVFVRAAEQMYKDDRGAEKLATVTRWMEGKLIELGTSLSPNDIRVLIECAVQKMNETKK